MFSGSLLGPGERLEELARLASRERYDFGPRLAQVRRRIVSAPMPREVERAIRDAYESILPPGTAVAVRSSSSTEDQASLSSAGMQETFLNVRGAERLLDAVRRCWSSLWHERALSYLAAAGIDPASVRMGVLVQELVVAEAAGIAFTCNPTTGNDREILVNAVLGLGEPAMSGRHTPDVFVIEKGSFAVRDGQVAHKTRRLVPAPDGEGLAEEDVPRELRDMPSVDARTLGDIALMAVRIEERIGACADVEWAVRDGRVTVLQARPVTTRAQRFARRARIVERVRRFVDPTKQVPGGMDRTIWTNANVGEALPGPATPLTWSVALAFQEKGFKHVFRVIGCRVPPGTNLVASWHGRFYLNLSAMLEIASQVPVLDPREALELGGVTGIPKDLMPSRRLGSVTFLGNLPFTIHQVVTTYATIDRSVRRYVERFETDRREFASAMDSDFTDEDLAGRLEWLSALLDRTGQVMLSCMTFSLASHLLLRQAFRHWFGDDARRLEREAMSGFSEIESASPGLSLWHIAETFRACPRELEILVESRSLDLSLESFPADSKVHRALLGFVSAYGYRGIKEAELASPRWSEDPTFLFETLKSYLASPGDSVASLMERQKNTRQRAAREIEGRLGLVERSLARHMLEMTRKYTRLRERMRARVIEVLGMFRRAALEAGRRLAGDEDAAFFLTLGEIRAYLAGRLRSPENLIRERREQHGRDALVPDPPSVFVGYPPQWRPPERHEGRTLLGIAASPGRGEGMAHVLRDPSQASGFKPGQVLVIPHADVGWTPLFLVASAIVTDIGGVLSHAAVVAREYGVPMVMNTRFATSKVKTGDALLVDGDRGVVYIL
jgi:pyruvate,water dikinase